MGIGRYEEPRGNQSLPDSKQEEDKVERVRRMRNEGMRAVEDVP